MGASEKSAAAFHPVGGMCACGSAPCDAEWHDQTAGEVPPEVYGKPFHGWACTCDECVGADLAGRPRDGEAPKPDPYQALLTQLYEVRVLRDEFATNPWSDWSGGDVARALTVALGEVRP